MDARRLPLLLCVACAAPAADGIDEVIAPSRRVSDLRLIGLSTPEWELANAEGDRGSRVGVAYFRSLVDDFEGNVSGLLLGLEVSRSGADGDVHEIEAWLATAHAGLAWQTDVRPLHLELGGLFGAGQARVETADETDHTTAFEFGLRLALVWTFSVVQQGTGPQLGIEGRWTGARAATHDPEGTRATAEANGGSFGASLGWRF